MKERKLNWKTETGTVLHQAAVAPDVVQANAAVEVKPAAAPAPEVPKAVEPAKPAAAVTEQENLHKITSPMVGTFYQSPAPDSPAYVKAGDKVTGIPSSASWKPWNFSMKSKLK